MKIKFLSFTKQGRRTSKNCDYFVAEELPQYQQYLFSVCDGMNGIPGGERASSFCGEMLKEDFQTFAPLDHPANWLEDEFHTINRKILLNINTKASASTMLCSVISENKLYLANAGDCRALLLRDNETTQLTRDDNLAWELLEAGQITEYQYLRHPKKNIIKNYMGKKSGLNIQQYGITIQTGDLLILCSDGISGFLTNQDVALTLQSKWDNIIYNLYQKAITAGSHDDITFIIIGIE